MTVGGKIREARRKCGFSQEQLAEKMAVSRSAVAKWETDKGLPDVGNLKTLARLLNVSVDHLLDDAQSSGTSLIRERYNLDAYGYGCNRVKKERVVRERYPDATICPLLGRRKLEELEMPSDKTQDCRTNPVDRIRQIDKTFYLVEKENSQLLVTVTDTFLEIRPLEKPIHGNSFSIDGLDFVKCNYEIL